MTSETTLRERSEIDALVEGKTVVDYFNRNAETHPDQPAIHWRDGELWKYLTWSQYRTTVHEVAAGLRTLGVDDGDFVAIMAGNRPEHVIADLAAIHGGAAGVTVYSTLAPSQIEYIAGDCSAKVAVLENLEFMKRWDEIRDRLPGLTHVVLMEDADHYAADDGVLSWDDLLVRGREALAAEPDLVTASSGRLTPDHLATLIYTSGTTGTPKGVMITHRNVVWTAECARRAFDLPANARGLSYLPLAHIAERMATHYLGIYIGGETAYCPELSQVLEYVQHHRPQLFLGVPRVWEKFHTRLRSRFAENPKRALIERALANAVEKIEAEQDGRSPGLMTTLKAALFDRLVFAKVREQLGMDEVQTAITAAAPIDPSLLVFFQAIGVPLFELYGLSETTGPATSNRHGQHRIGTVGPALPGVEVELGEEGEVLLRGGVITAGYYNLPEESAESFDPDGWLHTGDLGILDDDGFLSIVGRKKEIIITAAGKNVAPAKIETSVKNHPLIAQACMVGDQRRFLSLVVALDGEEAPLWAEARGVPFEDLASFSRSEVVRDEVQRAVDEANEQVSRAEQVKTFVIVPDEWTPESGEVTASLKLKRRVVLERYAAEIDRMYA